jgi:uncharacterized membrane protein
VPLPEAAARAAGMGAVAGLRSMAAPAALGRAIFAGRIRSLERTPFAALGHPALSRALQALAVGEILADKLSVVPSRTAPGPLVGRAASGALAGAAIFVSEGHRATAGGALGAAAAIAAAFGGERLRALVGEKTGLPDPLVALVEDAVVLLVGSRSLRDVK